MQGGTIRPPARHNQRQQAQHSDSGQHPKQSQITHFVKPYSRVEKKSSAITTCEDPTDKSCSFDDISNIHFNTGNLSSRAIRKENLDLRYTKFFGKLMADKLFRMLESQVEYFTGDLLRIKVYGKWHSIPRKQVSYGDAGKNYSFSGITLPAKPWTPLISRLRDLVSSYTGYNYNFVLINRYKDGNDHIGEHRDDEADLDRTAPIASLSLGQSREFVLRHGDARKKLRHIDPVKITLEHGSLLLMNPPTNQFWYHSLPPRKSATGIRINMTFRCLV